MLLSLKVDLSNMAYKIGENEQIICEDLLNGLFLLCTTILKVGPQTVPEKNTIKANKLKM